MACKITNFSTPIKTKGARSPAECAVFRKRSYDEPRRKKGEEVEGRNRGDFSHRGVYGNSTLSEADTRKEKRRVRFSASAPMMNKKKEAERKVPHSMEPGEILVPCQKKHPLEEAKYKKRP